MEKKINKLMLFRFISILVFWTVFFFPALFIPKRFQYNTLWPIFTKLFLFAAKIRTHYCSNIPLNKMGNVIFASNQKCFADAFVALNYIRKAFSIVLKSEMNQNILFKFMAWKMSLIAVDRNETSSQVKAILKIKKLISKKYSILIFPEGSYYFNVPVGDLKRGVARIAKDTGVKVVPVAIYGVLNDFMYEKKFDWKDAYIKAGEALSYSDYNDEKLFLNALKSKIEKLYLSLEEKYKK